MCAEKYIKAVEIETCTMTFSLGVIRDDVKLMTGILDPASDGISRVLADEKSLRLGITNSPAQSSQHNERKTSDLRSIK